MRGSHILSAEGKKDEVKQLRRQCFESVLKLKRHTLPEGLPARLLVFLICYQVCGGFLVDVGQEVSVRKCGQVVVGQVEVGQIVVEQVVVEQVEAAAGQWPLPGSPPASVGH